MTSQNRILSNPLMTIKNELLHGAVVKGELPTVRRLLDRHKADITTRNSTGMSMLQIALLNGHTKLSEFLIQKGVDIHSSDVEGYTALHDAALVEDTTLVHKLISKGLSPLLTTNMGELVIDVAGSVQMERLLCEEMCLAGETHLARDYYIYLGLDHEVSDKMGGFDKRLLNSRGFHSHHPKSQHVLQGNHKANHMQFSLKLENMPTFKTQSEVSKNMPTCASRLHPSVTKESAESVLDIPLTTNNNAKPSEQFGSVPNCDVQCNTATDVNLKGPLEAYKEPSEEREAQLARKDKGIVEKDSNLIEKKLFQRPLQGDHQSSQLCGNQAHPQTQEFNRKKCNLSPKFSREAAAIKSLYQHNSFQLQIGLSLHSQDPGTSLDEDSLPANSQSQYKNSSRKTLNHCTDRTLSSSLSDLRAISSPSIVSSCKGTQNQSSCSAKEVTLRDNKSPLEKQFSQQKPHKKLTKTVSFADSNMTRNKGTIIGRSNSACNIRPSILKNDRTQKTFDSNRIGHPSSAERTHPSMLDHSFVLPADIMDQLMKKRETREGRAKNTTPNNGVDEMFDAGMRALSLKPRKSIISSHPKRRATISDIRRRRSVTFQPEVILQEIVTDGDVKAVSEILESGMIEDVNKMSPSGLTALHQSAIDGNLDCAKALVAKGADFNCTDCEGWTPLHAAVMNGCFAFVRFLLSSGANPALKNDNGETAYDMAKSRPIRKMLLHAMNGKNLDADDFSDGEYSGEEEEEYSDAETESDDDMEADTSGLFESNMEGTTSLKERLGLTHASALNNLMGDSNSPSPDLDSVFSSTSHVKYHNRERDLTDSTSSYGSLFEAEADEGTHTDIKRSSSKNLESDADKISESGISTMEGSSDCSHRSLALSSEDEFITLDSDLDPDSLDYKFQEACLYCDVDMVLKLIKYKCEIDVNRVNQTSGITALHHSVLEENFALVQHLVKDFEADLHVVDIDGWTPLHAASAVGNIQIAQFLLDKGAKASCFNNQYEFPADVAEDEAMKNIMLEHLSGNNYSLKR